MGVLVDTDQTCSASSQRREMALRSVEAGVCPLLLLVLLLLPEEGRVCVCVRVCAPWCSSIQVLSDLRGMDKERGIHVSWTVTHVHLCISTVPLRFFQCAGKEIFSFPYPPARVLFVCRGVRTQQDGALHLKYE